MKVFKKKLTLNLREDTVDKLKKYCEEDGVWNMSTFVDVAILDKLKQEAKNKKFLDSIIREK